MRGVNGPLKPWDGKGLPGRTTEFRSPRTLKLELPADIYERIKDAEAADLRGWFDLLDRGGREQAIFWMSVMLGTDVPLRDRMAAAREIRDTMYGKPSQTIDQHITFNPNLLRSAGLSDPELAALDAAEIEVPAELAEYRLAPPIEQPINRPPVEAEEEPEEDDEFDPSSVPADPAAWEDEEYEDGEEA